MKAKPIIIFASGSGTNTENVVSHFSSSDSTHVSYVLTNNADAGVIEKTARLGVPLKVFSRKDFYETDAILNFLQQQNPSLIVLAGFLWLVPEKIIQAFPKKIINIHPALLPNFGGKGMFGINVQKKVIESGGKETGISIHYVNEKYDAGDIIFQEKCSVDINDTPETLTEKIHALENKFFPIVIESLLAGEKIKSLHSR
ncbi:MAG: phosphoribosylglycinamide formyltransferase [Bacteroidia bacterium]|nr:phosphoribosylglycinamide formyltransferase [Bacteroidia bacterium]